MADRLAVIAAAVAVVASAVGFIPDLYRDPAALVAQTHGQDVANVLGATVLLVCLALARRGSIAGRFVATGALGYLAYTYVVYALLIVLNPATFLYIAVLGCGGWAFSLGFAEVNPDAVEARVENRLLRRTTAWFLIVVALLFAANLLRQIAGSVTSGALPAELQRFGWPMNPYFVMDLDFLLPLILLTGYLLLTRRPGSRFAVPLLVFAVLLGLSVIATVVGPALSGEPVDVSLLPVFVVVIVIAGLLAARALWSPSSSAR